MRTDEAWRRECEARYVLKLPGKDRRQVYLDLVGQRRGEEAKRELEIEIMQQWKKRKK